MRMPICDRCSGSEGLCEPCQKRYDSGEISDLDLRVSRAIYKLYEKNAIGESGFEKTISTPDFIVIATKSNVSALIGKGGRVVRILSDRLNKKVRIVKMGDVKAVASDLIAPARIAGLTKLYTPEEEKQRILIPESDRAKIILSEESIKKVISELCNANVEIKYMQ